MNLFKLKKDGKTVGYLKINDYIWWSTCGRIWLEIHPQEGCSDYFEDDHEWDEAHPYVCDDKNGDKVFAGDKVKWKPEDIDELCEEDEEEILDAEVAGGFAVFDIEGTDFVEAIKFKNIELIKEKP